MKLKKLIAALTLPGLLMAGLVSVGAAKANQAEQTHADDYELEAYDTVSLKDANMPDFDHVAINTEDAAGYNYTTDPAALPMQKGFFGLTNNTGSYAFQFKFTKEVQSAGWFDVRIGGTGSWGSGHFLKFSFSNEWAVNGCGFVYEYQGTGDIWSPTELQKSPEFNTHLVSGENTLEMGTIKVKNYTNKYYVFFKNNGTVCWDAYWDLAETGRSTKVGMYYNNADAKISNTIEPTATDKFTVNSGTNAIYFGTANDVCPAVSNWDDYFKSVDGNGLKMNGVAFGGSNWNYFKKTGGNEFYLDLGGAGISSLNIGDLLTIGGMFKAARNVNGAYVLYKANLIENTFEYDGSAWHTYIPDYGTFVFDSASLDSTVSGMYAVNSTTNDLPAGWETEAFAPVDTNSGAFIGNTRVGTEIKKITDNNYYIPVTGAAVDTVVTVKGTWKNSIAQFTVQDFSRQWNGSRWVVPVVDYGTIVFDSANLDSTVTTIYAVNPTTNDIPAGWETEAFAPVDDNAGAFIDGVRVGTELKKIGDHSYYIPVTGADVDSIVVIKGTWANSTAKFIIQEFARQWNGTRWVQPVYDYGTITFNATKNDSAVGYIYGLTDSTNDIPAGWETEAFAPVDENSGTFVDGVRVGTEIKKLDANTYYIPVPGASVGTVATVKGTWKNSYAKFVVAEFTREWNGKTWGLPLVEYDKLSLVDANLPDFPNGKINTEDAPGHGYNGDPAQLPKQKSVFGLTNDTQSYSFEFNFETSDTMTNWADFRVGASGGWETGHFLRYQFTNQWNDGVLIIGEYEGSGVVNGHTKEVRTDVTNGPRLIEFGAIKAEGTENTYFVFFKNNGQVDFAEFWELSDAPRSTKIGIYAPDSCISITNSINPAAHDISINAEKSTSTAIYFDTETDVLKPVADWEEYFIPVEDGIRYNFASVTEGKWNYFKKPYEKQLYLDLGTFGVSPEAGDILFIGGMFKMAHANGGVLTAYKLNIENKYFEYDGNAWGEVSAERYAEILAQTKIDAALELDALADQDAYDDANYAIVEGIVNNAKAAVENATTIEQINAIVANAKEQLLAQAKTKLALIEESIMSSNDLLEEYLEAYDVITTTDLSAVGPIVIKAKGAGGYSSGGYDDTTTRYVTSPQNLDGNAIFQFSYSSSDPTSNEYGAQAYIRMRGSDSDCYRFDIANDVGEGHAGVGISVLSSDVAVDRKVFDANFEANESYKIECGSIDLAGYARTLLFIRINGEVVVKEIVDSVNEQQAAIRIMDSYTSGDDVARFAPIEAGTTKSQNNPTLLGRLKLDESSNKSGLFATLKANSLPENATLFPNESGAFTINGEEVESWRSTTNIKKVGDQKYKVEFDSAGLSDGDVVHVGGYFSYLDDEYVKSGFRFFDAEFVYHASSDSWTQNVPTDRETIVYEAKETLQNYANNALYSEANQAVIAGIVEEYLGKIDAAETEQISAVLAEALALIDAVPTILDEAKAAAKSELASYRSEDLYRDEEKAELNEILASAYDAIDAAANQSEIDAIVAEAKAAIDELKTAEQRDAEDLAAKKKAAKADINALAGKLEMDRYSDANQDALTNLTYAALEDIDKATSEAEIDQIVESYREDIIAVETKDGSVFDGDKYVGGGSEEKPDEKPSEKDDEEQPTTIWEQIVSFAKKALQGLKNFLRDLFNKISGFFQN